MKSILRVALSTLALFVLLTGSASAHHHRYHQRHHSAHHLRSDHVRAAATAQPNFFSLFSGDTANYLSPVPKLAATVRHVAEVSFAVEHQTRDLGSARPSDCYGIPWCGCYLRHYFGIADRSLNLAANWRHVGHPGAPHSGAIIVWAHHVGVMRSDPDATGKALILSGNSGRGGVTERLRSIRGAIAFRDI